MSDLLIRSKKRVKDLGEVFTPPHIVNEMLDLVKDEVKKINSRVLEPSCGTGNFLIEILARKMVTVVDTFTRSDDVEFYTLYALSSIYGVDIAPDNVADSKERMKQVIGKFAPQLLGSEKSLVRINYILNRNIICGDFLNGQDKIHFVEFSSPMPYMFEQKTFCLLDLLLGRESLFGTLPISENPAEHYLLLGMGEA